MSNLPAPKYINTPVIPCKYVYMDEPSQYGKYEITLLFNKTDQNHMQFLNMLKAEVKSIGGNTLPVKVAKDDANIIEVKCTQDASKTVNGKTYEFKPKVFNAQAQPIVEIPKIGNGTTVCLNLEMRFYDYAGKRGIRLNPMAMQIVDLVEYVEESAGGHNPFEAQNGGFTGDVNPFQAQQQAAPQPQQQAAPEPDSFQDDADFLPPSEDGYVQSGGPAQSPEPQPAPADDDLDFDF